MAHKLIRLPVPKDAVGVLTSLRIVLPLLRRVRVCAAAHSVVVRLYVAQAPRDSVASMSLQASRVVRVRSVTVQTPTAQVACVRLDTWHVGGMIRHETPPATPFGYPDRLRSNSEERLRAIMPAAAMLMDDIVRHFGRPARVRFVEAGHVIEA